MYYMCILDRFSVGKMEEELVCSVLFGTSVLLWVRQQGFSWEDMDGVCCLHWNENRWRCKTKLIYTTPLSPVNKVCKVYKNHPFCLPKCPWSLTLQILLNGFTNTDETLYFSSKQLNVVYERDNIIWQILQLR